MKFCPNCGAKIVLENAKFCHECGFNLFGAKQRVEVPTYSEDEKVENNELKYYKGSASKYSVSNGIVTIKYHAIESDSIKTLVIPSSVTKIESGGINIVKSNEAKIQARDVEIKELKEEIVLLRKAIEQLPQ